MRDKIINGYFEWMIRLVYQNKPFTRTISYRKLLSYLHGVEFRYSMPMDANRAADGINLRWRYACDMFVYPDERVRVEQYLSGPCSVLEMMVALAIRCEDHIMEDSDIGNRTGQWFWTMLISLGLNKMTDDIYDRRFVEKTITKFLDRDYDETGRGGLFVVEDCKYDLRTVEIWYQMCFYLDSIS